MKIGNNHPTPIAYRRTKLLLRKAWRSESMKHHRNVTDKLRLRIPSNDIKEFYYVMSHRVMT